MHTTQSPAAAEETEKVPKNLKYDEEPETNQTKHPADSLDEVISLGRSSILRHTPTILIVTHIISGAGSRRPFEFFAGGIAA